MKKITIIVLGLIMFFGSNILNGVFGESESQKTKNQHKISTTNKTSINDDIFLNWKSYKNKTNRIEIKYPEKIIRLLEDGKKTKLIHTIPYKHYDFGNMRDDAPMLDEFTDFNVIIEVVNKNLKETVFETAGNYVKSNFFKNNKFIIKPGFIDEISIGLLKGYRITSGCGGSGIYEYYFVLNLKSTLFITRRMIPEVTSICGNYKEYLDLPGVISHDTEEILFNKIIASFKLID